MKKHRIKPRPKACDYCGERPPEGYVPQYEAWVCRQCYEDHHEPID